MLTISRRDLFKRIAAVPIVAALVPSGDPLTPPVPVQTLGESPTGFYTAVVATRRLQVGDFVFDADGIIIGAAMSPAEPGDVVLLQRYHVSSAARVHA